MHNILYLVPFPNLLSKISSEKGLKNMKSTLHAYSAWNRTSTSDFLNLGAVFWVLSSIHYTSKFCGQSAIQRQASSTTRREKACTPSAPESWVINSGKGRNTVLFDLAPYDPKISRRLLNVGPTVGRMWWAKNMLWSLLDFSWQAWDKLGSLFQPVNDNYLPCHVPVTVFVLLGTHEAKSFDIFKFGSIKLLDFVTRLVSISSVNISFALSFESLCKK